MRNNIRTANIDNVSGGDSNFVNYDNVISLRIEEVGEEADTEIKGRFTSNEYALTECYIGIKKKNYKHEESVIDYAFNVIGSVCYDDISNIERSNLFDEWKSIIIRLADYSSGESVEFRQILGMLSGAIEKKDIISFEKESLVIFLNATNILRSHIQISSIDVESVYLSLDKLGFVSSLQLYTNNQEVMRSLDKEIDAMVARHSENEKNQ